jgi:hypothetical protein
MRKYLIDGQMMLLNVQDILLALLRSRLLAELLTRSRYASNSCCSHGMKTQRNTMLILATLDVLIARSCQYMEDKLLKSIPCIIPALVDTLVEQCLKAWSESTS